MDVVNFLSYHFGRIQKYGVVTILPKFVVRYPFQTYSCLYKCPQQPFLTAFICHPYFFNYPFACQLFEIPYNRTKICIATYDQMDMAWHDAPCMYDQPPFDLVVF